MTLILHRKCRKQKKQKKKIKSMAKFLGTCFQIAFQKSSNGTLLAAAFEQSSLSCKNF